MDDGITGMQPESLSDHELARRDEVSFYQKKGMSRRDIIKTMGLGAVLGTGAIAALAACSSSGDVAAATAAATDTATAAAGGKKLKALEVSFGDVIPWCVQITDSMRFYGEKFNVELTHVDGGATPESQVKAFEEAATREAWDFVALTPIAPNSLAPTARALIDKGIPVIQLAVDIGKPGEDIGYLTYISQDYEEAGYSIAADLFAKAGGKGNVIVTQGVAGAGNVVGRSKGVNKALAQFPDMVLLEEAYTDYSDAASKRLWDAYVQKYPDIAVALEMTAGTAALNGAVAALEAAGRTGKTLVGSNNAEDFACQAVIDGKLSATVRHSSVLLGMWAAVIGAQYKTGVVTEVPKTSWMPAQLVNDNSKAKSMLDLQAKGVFLV